MFKHSEFNMLDGHQFQRLYCHISVQNDPVLMKFVCWSRMGLGKKFVIKMWKF